MKNNILNKFFFGFVFWFVCGILVLIFSKFTWLSICAICSITYFLLYLILKNTKINLIFLGHMYNLFLLIPILLAYLYVQTNLYFNLSIYEICSMIEKNMKTQEPGTYIVYNRSIKNENGNIVLDWSFSGSSVEKGKIIVENEKIEYQLQLKDKCIYKKLDEKEYNIIESKCEGL